MKIVFLLCSPDINGGTNVILEHAGGLQRQGHEVTIATAEKVAPSRYAWHWQGASVHWRTIDELQDEAHDVAIATWWESPYLLHKIVANHYVYFVQSIESKFFPEENPANLDTRDHSTGVTRCNNGYFFSLPVITEATWIKQFLEIHYNHRPYLVRNGMRKELYRDETVIEPRREGWLRVLVEGPVEVFHKNVPRTVALCRQAGVDEIWLLTSSPIDSFPGVDRVFSQISFDLTPPVYRSCDVLVKLSYVEGMFGPPLEMFHCGGTAIVYAVTGHDEYLRHGINGLVVKRDDEQGVIDFLKELQANRKLLADLCRGAYATAREWPDWTVAGEQFAEALIDISRQRPSSRTALQNLAETFTTHQRQQIEARELARFAQRENEERDAPGAYDNFVQVYGEGLTAGASGQLWAHYRCGAKTVARVAARIAGGRLHLRVDPSVRIGIIKLYALRISTQQEGRVIAEFLPKNGFSQLHLTGTAKWLEKNDDHWVIESYGNDPQLFLPMLAAPEGAGEIAVEVSLQEMGISEYIGERTGSAIPRRSRSRWVRLLGKLGLSSLLIPFIKIRDVSVRETC